MLAQLMRPDQVIVVSHHAMVGHDPGPGHPERPERLAALFAMLQAAQVPGLRVAAPPAPATRQQLGRVHSPEYVNYIESLHGRSARLDADTIISPASVEAASLAAGAAVHAVDAVMRGGTRRSMALVRPPGHHAEPDRAMGFCLFNNIAVAAAHAIEAHGCERVLIVDWDVHHGNGTQRAFYHRRDVLFFSAHQWPFYPGTGALDEQGQGDGRGFTVNAPLPAGFDDGGYAELFSRVLAPIADAFSPQLVLVSAGFDAHRDDPLADMDMSAAGFAALCGIVCGIADRHAGGRVVLALEGGYDIAALCDSVLACAGVLAGAAVPPAAHPPDESARSVIERIRAFHRRQWPAL